MQIERNNHQHLNIVSFLLCVYQQFKKAVLLYGQQRLWPIVSTTQAGNVRGYTGVALQCPKREPAVEFGGHIMAERIQHYMFLNPKLAPPVEVSSYRYYIYFMLSLGNSTHRRNAEHYVYFSWKLHDVPSEPVRQAGKCAFASPDIRKCEVICKYEGEVVTVEEAKVRKESYQEEGKVCALLVFESAGRQIAWVLL